MKKSQVYFIMYIVLITELLIVITERDELMEKENQVKKKLVASIAQQYKREVEISVTPDNEFKVGKDSVKVSIVVTGLVSDEEKKAAVYSISSEGGKSPGSNKFPSSLTSDAPDGAYSITKDENGNANLEILKATNIGEYELTVTLTVKRQLPTYLPKFLLDELKKESGFKDGAAVTTKPVKFKIKISAQPAAPAATKGGDVINVGPSID
jgi:hypothetical protein